jgi:hypothetical protein
MKIQVISFWYNEEFLAPFFFKHYSFADHIRLLVDADTNDGTLGLISKQPGVTYRLVRFKDGMNTQVKQDMIHAAYRESDADWVVLVDADEFIKPGHFRLLSDAVGDVFNVNLYQVYRHRFDRDLTPDLPTLAQRRHGDPNITSGVNALYRKPIVARTGLNFTWSPGCHRIYGSTLKIDPRPMVGAHWAMADPCFCIDRRLSRRARISAYNRKRGMSWHNAKVTRESLLAECEVHLDDPMVV